MHKLKKSIADFREYLGRDEEGLRRLQEVSTLANTLRTQKSTAEESFQTIKDQLERLRQEHINVQTEIKQLKQDLETERAKRRTAEVHEERIAVDFAQYREEMERVPEDLVAVEEGLLNDMPKFRMLLKEVRRRFKNGPPKSEDMRQVVWLEQVVKSYATDEFTSLGMLLAVLALSNFPTVVKSKTTFVATSEGWTEKDSEKFLSWYKTWIRVSSTDVKINGPCDMMVTESSPFGLRKISEKKTIKDHLTDNWEED